MITGPWSVFSSVSPPSGFPSAGLDGFEAFDPALWPSFQIIAPRRAPDYRPKKLGFGGKIITTGSPVGWVVVYLLKNYRRGWNHSDQLRWCGNNNMTRGGKTLTNLKPAIAAEDLFYCLFELWRVAGITQYVWMDFSVYLSLERKYEVPGASGCRATGVRSVSWMRISPRRRRWGHSSRRGGAPSLRNYLAADGLLLSLMKRKEKNVCCRLRFSSSDYNIRGERSRWGVNNTNDKSTS